MDFALGAKMAKYASLFNTRPDDVTDDKVVNILQDFGVAKNITPAQVGLVRAALRDASVESLGQLATQPAVLETLKGIFAPKETNRAVTEGNQLSGSVVHQCGHCKQFNLVPFHVELG